jgi:hypothetical protein
MTTTEIKAARETRDEQNVTEILSNELPHFFASGEHLIKTVRRMARKGLVTLVRVPGGVFARQAVR